MNFLQTFLAAANAQARPIVQEAFRFVTDISGTIYYGTFGDPLIMPVMTRQGYQDHLVTPLKAEANQWTAQMPPISPSARVELVRIETGRTFFVQIVDYTEVVVYTFILTDREL